MPERQRERESVCVCERGRVAENRVGIHCKMAVGERLTILG
jgi:hypothetical protein